MAIDFPNSPSTNDTYTVGNKTWIYDGTTWNTYNTTSFSAETLPGTTLKSTVTESSLTSVGTLGSLNVTGNVVVDTNTLYVNSTNNRVGVGTASPLSALDVIGNIRSATSTPTDGIILSGNGSGSFVRSVTLTPASLAANRTLTLPDATGTVITTGNLSDFTVTAGTTTTGATGPGYMGLPQNATTTGAYRLLATDAGKHIYSTATRTITIPGNATGGSPQVAFPIGSTIVFVNATGTTLTLSMDGTTTDTCLLSSAGTSMTGGSGSRTLAAFGMATLLKITSTSWIISGNGLT